MSKLVASSKSLEHAGGIRSLIKLLCFLKLMGRERKMSLAHGVCSVSDQAP